MKRVGKKDPRRARRAKIKEDFLPLPTTLADT